MARETSDEIVVNVSTKEEMTAAGVAHFMTGVAIMQAAIDLSISRDQRGFVARLGALRSPFLMAPEQVLGACGQAWAVLGDWPPMDPVVRGALTEGLLEACNPSDSPRIVSVKSGSFVTTLRTMCGLDKKQAAADAEDPLARGVRATKMLIGRSDRAAFKDEMVALLAVDQATANPAAAFAMGAFGTLPLGVVMFGCQRMEDAYRFLGATDVKVSVRNSKRFSKNSKRFSKN
jgi:hypothetical protein